jgi:hypothetical protein
MAPMQERQIDSAPDDNSVAGVGLLRIAPAEARSARTQVEHKRDLRRRSPKRREATELRERHVHHIGLADSFSEREISVRGRNAAKLHAPEFDPPDVLVGSILVFEAGHDGTPVAETAG